MRENIAHMKPNTHDWNIGDRAERHKRIERLLRSDIRLESNKTTWREGGKERCAMQPSMRVRQTRSQSTTNIHRYGLLGSYSSLLSSIAVQAKYKVQCQIQRSSCISGDLSKGERKEKEKRDEGGCMGGCDVEVWDKQTRVIIWWQIPTKTCDPDLTRRRMEIRGTWESTWGLTWGWIQLDGVHE